MEIDKATNDHYLDMLEVARVRWQRDMSPAEIARAGRLEQRYLEFRRRGGRDRKAPFVPQHQIRKTRVFRGGRPRKPRPPSQKPVTERALYQRINRALPEGQKLRIARGGAAETRGDFYLVKGGGILNPNVDIQALAYDLGVLKAGEALYYPPPRGRPAKVSGKDFAAPRV